MKDKQHKQNIQKYTLYSVRAQLALDGYPNTELNCHEITEAGPTEAGQVQRCNVKCLVEKTWCVAYKKRKEEGKIPTWMNGLAWVHDLTNIPNEFVKLIWLLDLVPQPQPTLRMVSPQLIWSTHMDLAEGQIFRWA